MIQTYQILEQNVIALSEQIEGKRQIQKIFSTSRYICLDVRVKGRSVTIYIGRGHGYEGLWFSPKPPISSLRVRDRFLEFLRKHLKNTSIQDIELDQNDRCIKITTHHQGNTRALLLFWKGRKLYFVYGDKEGGWASWNMAQKLEWDELSFDIFDNVGRKDINKNTVKGESSIDELLKEEFEAIKNNKVINTHKAKLEKKKKLIEGDLKIIESASRLKQELAQGKHDEVITKDLKLKIKGIRFKFKRDENLYQRKDSMFKRLKRLDKALEVQEKRLKEVENKLSGKVNESEIKNNLDVISPVWLITKSNQNNVENKGNYKVYQKENLMFAIGLDSKGNDNMRKEWAKKDDLWFHLDAGKSAHVICKNHEANGNIFEIAKIVGKIMNENTNDLSQEIDLIYTKVKNLKGVKGTPGKVIFKNEKRIRINID